MKKINWQILLGLGLVALSALLYLVQFFIFKNANQALFYFLQDIAFVPIQVLFVTLIIDKLLSVRDKRDKFNKLNMIIGAFFSEVGTTLIQHFAQFDPDAKQISGILTMTSEWNKRDFLRASKLIKKHEYNVVCQYCNLEDLQKFLKDKKQFLLGLLNNPNLLEHDAFTDLLWSVFHLSDELSHRKKISILPKNDLEHLSIDVKRAYNLLISQWLFYMDHLRADYPYLFSLAIRTNPFNPQADAVVR